MSKTIFIDSANRETFRMVLIVFNCITWNCARYGEMNKPFKIKWPLIIMVNYQNRPNHFQFKASFFHLTWHDIDIIYFY